MDATREERMQQRLRGSQRHQVKEVDFGLTFPVVPIPEEPSSAGPSRRSPRLELPTPIPLQQTPGNEDTPAQEPATETVNASLKRGSNNIDANTSAKRRKLDTDDPRSSGSRSTRSRPQSIPDAFETPGEPLEEEPRDNLASDGSASIHTEASPVHVSSPDLGLPESVSRSRVETTPVMDSRVQEVSESPVDAPGSGRRKITDVTSSQVHPTKSRTPSPVKPKTTPGSRRKSQREEVEASPSVHDDSFDRNELENDSSVVGIAESSPTKPRKRARKQNVTISVPEEEQDGETSNQEDEEAEAIGDVEAAAILRKHQGRRRSRNIPAPSPDLDEAEQRQTKPAKTRRKQPAPVVSPAEKRQPRPQPKVVSKVVKKSVAKSPKKPAKGARVRMGSPIPVTVYRLTSKPAYDDEDSDYEIPVDKRAGMNTVDVLGQVCQEIISSGSAFIERSAENAIDSTQRRECRNKHRALKVFGEELHLRLLTQQTTLDNTFSLEKRVREEQRKKLSLREEIRLARAERQEVAFRLDEVRIKHEMESKHAEGNHELNLAMHDVELAVDHGRSHSQTDNNSKSGVEVLLKRVAGLVSKKGGSGGILEQIKNFNGFLERAASALESKKS
ncbi:hypothetical protein HYALB_00010967 [Hymenoscyphus albidus]|uniref:Inner kinetochore subunit AME1 domain-containing protein n=1 Tax=Hymenoscyphus albidus TaxID=595503 RepID=A0A9N9LW53_9HELO|nr:hypothetical protein HYALB_00010967 [Hymenoscyphus albidus]